MVLHGSVHVQCASSVELLSYRGVARNFIRGFPVCPNYSIPAYDVIVHHQNGCRKQSEILAARIMGNNERGEQLPSITVQQQQKRPVAMLTDPQGCCS